MIKENKNIKGIFIGDYEHKLLGGTFESIESALNTIEIFGTFSGLKMNGDKTKVIWIRRKKYSCDKLITSLKLGG